MFLWTMTDPLGHLLGKWAEDLTVYSILFRIILTIVMAFFIGYERSTKRHSAGLRTFMLVALASCVAMILDLYLIENQWTTFALLSVATIVSSAMISGNSILFSSKKQIKGLTTSAGLWVCCIIGLTAGAGLYTTTIALFFTLLIILAVFPHVEVFLKNKSNHFEIHLELKNKNNLQDFVTTIRKLGLKVDDIELNSAYIGSGLSVYTISITIINKQQMKEYKSYNEVIEALRTLDYIYFIEEI